MDIIVRIFALGLIGSIATIILNKAKKEDLAVVLDLALVIVALAMVYPKIRDLFNGVSTMFGGGF